MKVYIQSNGREGRQDGSSWPTLQRKEWLSGKGDETWNGIGVKSRWGPYRRGSSGGCGPGGSSLKRCLEGY